MDSEAIENGLTQFLTGLEIDDPLFDVAVSAKAIGKAWQTEFLGGYQQSPAEILVTEPFDGPEQLIAMTDISFVSFCVHHFLPFKGIVHLAYVPNERLTGLSRLVKLVHCFAHRLQIQERMGEQIIAALMTELEAAGAACYIEATHFCVCARGSRSNSKTITTIYDGCFRDHISRRQEFLHLCR